MAASAWKVSDGTLGTFCPHQNNGQRALRVRSARPRQIRRGQRRDVGPKTLENRHREAADDAAHAEARVRQGISGMDLGPTFVGERGRCIDIGGALTDMSGGCASERATGRGTAHVSRFSCAASACVWPYELGSLRDYQAGRIGKSARGQILGLYID